MDTPPSPIPPNWVVADAVGCEPVSGRNSQKNTGEIAFARHKKPLDRRKRRIYQGFWIKIDTKYQGIFFEITGDELYKTGDARPKIQGIRAPLLGLRSSVNSPSCCVIGDPPLAAPRILYKAPAALKPRPKNPRTHSAKQIKQIAASIKEFGFVNPVLIDGANGIIAGHGRVEAAIFLGMGDIPTVRVDHLSPSQIRAYVIADNRLAENAGWDRKLLALELQEISVDLNFDVTVTGFETAEIDILVSELTDTGDEADELPNVDRTMPAVSRLGDRWLLGDHVLLCGDALSRTSYAALLGSKKAQMVFTDPPYNVAIAGHVSGLGRTKHRDFAMASGEMTEHQFIRFLKKTFEQLVHFSTNGSIHFICMDWRHISEVTAAAAEPYGEFKNVCVWVKTNAGMGSLYRSQHELVFVMKNGTAPHINNVELGRFGRTRTNVWKYGGVNSFGSNRGEELAMHPTVKPLALVADAILDCSKRGGIVLDAFAGSGTTLIASEKTGRRGYGMEIDPHYTDVIIRRFKQVYAIDAIHADSKLDFDQIRADRLKRQGKQNDKESEDNQKTARKVRRSKARPKSA
jgi:DNA modification methylase